MNSIFSRAVIPLTLSVFRIARNLLGDSRPRFVPGSFGAIKDQSGMN